MATHRPVDHPYVHDKSPLASALGALPILRCSARKCPPPLSPKAGERTHATQRAMLRGSSFGRPTCSEWLQRRDVAVSMSSSGAERALFMKNIKVPHSWPKGGSSRAGCKNHPCNFVTLPVAYKNWCAWRFCRAPLLGLFLSRKARPLGIPSPPACQHSRHISVASQRLLDATKGGTAVPRDVADAVLRHVLSQANLPLTSTPKLRLDAAQRGSKIDR